ncbi:TetR/AcrR family transcriptional regulator [Streptomyces sp. SID11385]|uniref:TetR/AcrR family transcriptional regulator n=1 Tax=Streptomyces sp. SID11385 TaxID=2706031 RepID=UPI0013CC5228|nr:TetR/AcrR family transcriptional regulator [Streptomyces sp. SID11385]NEA38672.1 TetR family transcriptional regulator [Streptomyces sp. SID11385]
MEKTVGLRERKKAATREAVHKAALSLAVEHGFEHVTVEAIADAAGISRRTFSNYFTAKEDAVLWGEEQHIKGLVLAFRARPAHESPWQALAGAVLDRFPTETAPDRETAIRSRLALRHPTLLARQLANHAVLETDLREAITDRGGLTPLEAGCLGAAFLASIRLAMQRWIASDETDDPRELIMETMGAMAGVFG